MNVPEAIAGSASEILRRHGFKVRVVERPRQKVPSIEAARKKLPSCRFDIKRCRTGIEHMENYQWTWDEQGETYRKTPKHNEASNCADAFQTFGWWHKLHGGSGSWASQKSEHGVIQLDSYQNRPRGRRAPKNRGTSGRFGHIL